MNFKLTLTLVILMVVICITYVVVTKWAPVNPAGPKEAATSTPVLSPKPAGIKEIALSMDGDRQVAFSRGEKGWEMTFPVAAKAESWQIESIADSLSGLSYKDTFAAQPAGNHSAQTTGLEKPKYVVTFTDDGGKNYTLGLGKRTVGGIYATLDGGKTVYVLASDPLESLDKPADSFRDKSIKAVDTDKIAELTVTHGAETVTLKKSGDQWLITKPISARANAAKVNEMLAEFKQINAIGFSDMAKDSAATGLNPPIETVTAMVGGAAPTTQAGTAPASMQAVALTPVTLQLGYYTDLLEKKNVYASMGESKNVFTLAASSFDKLNEGLQQLRDPAITPARVADATGVTLTTEGKVAVKVEKKDGKWELENATPAVAAGELEVGNWLGDLQNLRAIKFVDDAGDLKSIGLDPPVTRIELVIPGQSQHEVILVGKAETADKVTPMMRQGEPTVYLVQTADAQAIMQSNLTLRDKTVERLASDRIRGITVEGAGAGGGGFELLRTGAVWDVKRGGTSVKADEEKVTGLLAEFTPLTAAKYLAEKADVAGKADLTVTLEVAEPVVNEAATKPAGTMAATGPATGTAPAKLPAGLMGEPAGVEQAKIEKRVLRLFKTGSGKDVVWKAVWDGKAPQWTFEPTAGLVKDLTGEEYAAVAATQERK